MQLQESKQFLFSGIVFLNQADDGINSNEANKNLTQALRL